jgi:hypothetical protein
MIKFEAAYFRKFNFTEEQINQFLNNALKDLEIAKENSRPEVKFSYSYSAFIKGGIALLAKVGKVKVRSIPGHHVKIIEKMKEILKDEIVETIGNAMRTKRNEDFYGGGILISEKESKDYNLFVEKVFVTIKKVLT